MRAIDRGNEIQTEKEREPDRSREAAQARLLYRNGLYFVVLLIQNDVIFVCPVLCSSVVAVWNSNIRLWLFCL